MTARRVELHIEELVLEGVRPIEAQRVGTAVERELARLLRDNGVPHRAGAGEDPAPVTLQRRIGEPPAQLGTRLAGAIYGRLGT
jgi:hypothetical protein